MMIQMTGTRAFQRMGRAFTVMYLVGVITFGLASHETIDLLEGLPEMTVREKFTTPPLQILLSDKKVLDFKLEYDITNGNLDISEMLRIRTGSNYSKVETVALSQHPDVMVTKYGFTLRYTPRKRSCFRGYTDIGEAIVESNTGGTVFQIKSGLQDQKNVEEVKEFAEHFSRIVSFVKEKIHTMTVKFDSKVLSWGEANRVKIGIFDIVSLDATPSMSYIRWKLVVKDGPRQREHFFTLQDGVDAETEHHIHETFSMVQGTLVDYKKMYEFCSVALEVQMEPRDMTFEAYANNIEDRCNVEKLSSDDQKLFHTCTGSLKIPKENWIVVKIPNFPDRVIKELRKFTCNWDSLAPEKQAWFNEKSKWPAKLLHKVPGWERHPIVFAQAKVDAINQWNLNQHLQV